jgi:hypothetical protein
VNVRIGVGRDGSRYFDGNIDDVAVWQRLLDGKEVAAVHGLGRIEGLTLGNDTFIDTFLTQFDSAGPELVTAPSGNRWQYAPGLTGGQGAYGGSGELGSYIVLDESGNGMQVVPDPGRPTFFNRSGAGNLEGWPGLNDFVNDDNRFGSGGASFGGSLGTAVTGYDVFYNLQGDGKLGKYSSFVAIEANDGTILGTHPTSVVDIATDGKTFYRLDTTGTPNQYDLVSFPSESDFANNTNSTTQTTTVIAGGLLGLAIGDANGTVYGLSLTGNLVRYDTIANLLIDNKVQTFAGPGLGGSRGIALRTVPEPSTFLIWTLGVLGLTLFGWRRRKR